MHVCTCVQVCECVRVCMCVSMRAHVHVYECACVYMRTCACVCVHTEHWAVSLPSVGNTSKAVKHLHGNQPLCP